MKFPLSVRQLALSLAFTGAFCVAPAHAQTTTIPQIQGTTDTSPLVNQTVTVEGVVTADLQLPTQFSGFYLQDAQGDGNPATSDGLFVYVNARSKTASVDVHVGDLVRVTGRVEEFHGQTQIGRTSAIEVLGQQTPPAPISISLPLPAGASFESFEGMSVTFPQKLVVTEQGQLPRFGALTLSSPTRLFVPTNQKPLEQNGEDDAIRRSFVLDDASGSQSPKPVPYLDENGTRRTGSTIQNVTGILSFDYEKYRLQPTAAPVFENANPRPLAPPNVGGTLKIGAANMHNYWTTFKNANPEARGAKNAAEFGRQSASTAAMIRGLDADVLGLMELENNGDTAIQDIVSKLNSAYGGPVYNYVLDVAGTISPGPIKVGIIYKTAAVAPRGAPLSFKDKTFDRYPLAQTFVSKRNGAIFTFVVNHFKSKSPGEETVDVDKGEGAFNQKRVQQAAKLLGFIKQLRISSGDADVISVGDYNAYTEEAPVLALRNGGLEHLNLRLPSEERYSFGFDGRYGSLDHAFATPELAKQVTGFAEWHVNADEPFFLDYSSVKVADFKASPFRASDHDPLLVGLDLKAETTKTALHPTVKKAAVKPKTTKKATPKKGVPKRATRKKR